MKIGIISDSHDHIENIKRGIQILRKDEVELIIHLGDYVNPNSVRAFEGTGLTVIFGNNDGDKFRIINAFNEIGAQLKGDV